MWSLLRLFYFFVSPSPAPAALQTTHADVFPELYGHPGFVNGQPDPTELKRRCDYISKFFPHYEEGRIRMMAEAGFRAEIRAGASAGMCPDYRCLEVDGPHPREFITHAAQREKAKTLLKLDLMDAVSSNSSRCRNVKIQVLIYILSLRHVSYPLIGPESL